MLALIYFLLFEGAGVAMAHFLLPRKSIIARIWIGLVLGLGLMMWLPALLAASLPAFAGLTLQYTRKGHFHILSLPIAALLIALAYVLTPQSPAANPTLEETARTIRQVIEDHLLFTSQRDSL